MILSLPDVVSAEELGALKQLIARAEFVDGRRTAGQLTKDIKNNLQIPANHPIMPEIARITMGALKRNNTFMFSMQPRTLAAIVVSRYQPGMAYGAHVDNPIMGEPNHVRTDISFTLFLNDIDTYQGGELAMASGSGESLFKLPAGSMIVYPTGQLHRVCPVTSGERLAVVGWVQSLVRDPAMREMLHDLAQTREQLVNQPGMERAFDLVNKTYANLLRRYAET